MIASQLKAGMVVRIEGQLYKVLEVESKAGAAKLGGVVKTKLRNVESGTLWEPHFRPDLKLEEVETERQVMEFLYSDEDNCVFMNPVSFEQVEGPRASLGPAERFLPEGTKVPVEFFEGRPISIVLPEIVEARIAQTAPAMHAGSDSAWKEAVLDNGLKLQVPLFIAPGELVRVDVETGRYLERIRLERKKGA